MTGEPEVTRVPTPRQVEWIRRVGERAASMAAGGKLEFVPVNVIDRIKLVVNPDFSRLIQQSIHEACLDSGYETQSFRPRIDRGDSTTPYEPLTVRVIEGPDVLGLSAVKEEHLIPYGHGYAAVDVYPPQD